MGKIVEADLNVVYATDCIKGMRQLPANSIDSIITDPPYGVSFALGIKHRSDLIPPIECWKEALRVAKPGAHILVFGCTPIFHRVACDLEDAGWELRDCLMWLYGSGLPKSFDVSRMVDRANNTKRKRVKVSAKRMLMVSRKQCPQHTTIAVEKARKRGFCYADSKEPASAIARTWLGYGTALRPCWEPILMAMKPREGNYGKNAIVHGVSGLNIKDTRTISKTGAKRWPGNILTDEAAMVILGEQGVDFRAFYCAKSQNSDRHANLPDGIRNSHPTVKPFELMKYLCLLTKTPTGGIVLDPFCGSGSTLRAARAVGRPFIGFDHNKNWARIAALRAKGRLITRKK